MNYSVFVLIIAYLISGCDTLTTILDDQEQSNHVKENCLTFSIGFFNGIGSESYRVDLKFGKGEIVFPKNFKVAVDDSLITDFQVYLWDTPFVMDTIDINKREAAFDEEVALSYHFTAKSYFEAKKFSLYFDNYAKCDNEFVTINSVVITE